MNDYVIVVDDDRTQRRMIASVLKSELGFVPIEAQNGVEALQCLQQSPNVKIVIIDLEMPVMDGRRLIKRMHQEYPHIPFIVLTGKGADQDSKQALKMGALDFLSKPLRPERLVVSIRNGLKISVMGDEISRLQRVQDGVFKFTDLIGFDGGLAGSVKIGKKAAASHLPVLLSGETGTGKELFARAIHGESDRHGQSFIAVNCGAIPEKLIESTLFGHEKGAFTGATNKALGKFREADGGTIFLDEVGELPLDAQVKLLRVLQQKEVEPVGHAKPIHVDVRVISATNRNLQKEVEAGRFREDLYFRLNVLDMHLPPLRARFDDIESLSRHFVQSYAATQNSPLKTISKSALKSLKQYSWPGNVRELENVIHRTMALSEEYEIKQSDLMLPDDPTSAYIQMAPFTIPLLDVDENFRTLKDLEYHIVKQALTYHNGNISQTARQLGIAKSTLYSKMSDPEAKNEKSAAAV